MKTYNISIQLRSEAENTTELEEEIDRILRKAQNTTIALVYNILATEATEEDKYR